MNKTYIILDLEATCYDNNDVTKPKDFQNEIIEIGAVKCNHLGEYIDEFQCFIKPKLYPILSNFCKNLTSISQEDVDNVLYYKDSIYAFIAWIYDLKYDKDVDFMSWFLNKEKDNNVTYISWGHYDKKQFQLDNKLHKINENWINDDNHISLKHFHQKHNKLKKGLGLGNACKFENIKFTGIAHRGIDDAKNVSKIFNKYLKYIK